MFVSNLGPLHDVLRCVVIHINQQPLVVALHICSCVPTPDKRLRTYFLLCTSVTVALNVQLPPWIPDESQQALDTNDIQEERHGKQQLMGEVLYHGGFGKHTSGNVLPLA